MVLVLRVKILIVLVLVLVLRAQVLTFGIGIGIAIPDCIDMVSEKRRDWCYFEFQRCFRHLFVRNRIWPLASDFQCLFKLVRI